MEAATKCPAWGSALFEELIKAGDHKRAEYMAAYMKNQFEFLGVPTPLRKTISRKYFTESPKEKVDFNFIEYCYDSIPREYQYVAVNYLEYVSALLKSSDIKLIERLITTKSWWDTVDGLDGIAGGLAEKYPSLNKKMIAWSKSANKWLRRAAIDHQLSRKEKTDLELLETIVVNNFGTSEFFINKAIGWALREYSKCDPLWVKAFIARHRESLSKLSLREASKYL